MVKIALKKCSFWLKLHFFWCKFGDFLGGRLFRSTRSTRSDWTLRGGLENYIEVVSVII